MRALSTSSRGITPSGREFNSPFGQIQRGLSLRIFMALYTDLWEFLATSMESPGSQVAKMEARIPPVQPLTMKKVRRLPNKFPARSIASFRSPSGWCRSSKLSISVMSRRYASSGASSSFLL